MKLNMYMIQDVGCSGSFKQLYRWHSVSELRSSPELDKHIRECQSLLHRISKAINFHYLRYNSQPEAIVEIRRLFATYEMLTSHIRQAEMEQVRSRLEEESRSVSPEFISVPYYEHELIRDK
jgi:uncharacterized protein (DUF2267 family)